MATIDKGNITWYLEAIADGQPDAQEKLFDLAYSELRSLAGLMMSHQRPGHTLQATALVNEATLRLIGAQSLKKVANRRHFFAAMAQAMRCVLVDHAKRRNTRKRGGDLNQLELDIVLENLESFGEVDLIELDEVLNKLSALHERHFQMVQLRFFLGMKISEICEQLEISKSTAERDWRFIRAWLAEELDR